MMEAVPHRRTLAAGRRFTHEWPGEILDPDIRPTPEVRCRSCAHGSALSIRCRVAAYAAANHTCWFWQRGKGDRDVGQHLAEGGQDSLVHRRGVTGHARIPSVGRPRVRQREDRNREVGLQLNDFRRVATIVLERAGTGSPPPPPPQACMRR